MRIGYLLNKIQLTVGKTIFLRLSKQFWGYFLCRIRILSRFADMKMKTLISFKLGFGIRISIQYECRNLIAIEIVSSTNLLSFLVSIRFRNRTDRDVQIPILFFPTSKLVLTPSKTPNSFSRHLYPTRYLSTSRDFIK